MSSPSKAKVLVVDDEPDLRTLYELTLLREGYQVTCAEDLSHARAELASQSYDVLISDMRLPDGLGLELLKEIAEQQRSERSIVITAYGSAENAVEALKNGAFDYLTKPVDLKQLRLAVVSAIQSIHRLPESGIPGGNGSHNRETGPATAGADALRRIIGSSLAMQQIRARIEKVATSMAPVLILGESGTGKELVANAIHRCSHRSDGPFVAVNCGAIPENLIEAEFFGARKGAYTGATHDREGYFQAAKGGTLFLDEIGDLPLAMQAKLLRVIQERRVRPLGGVQEESVDVRLVSATHKDLASLVQGGDFRQDLYYRLNVIELRTPALRERREDLPELAAALLQKLSEEAGHPAPVLSDAAIASLQERELPGNVRELENLLQRALALSSEQVISPDDFGDTDIAPISGGAAMQTVQVGVVQSSLMDGAPSNTADTITEARLPDDLQQFLDAQERQVLLQALKECGYNRTAAAARLGLNLRQMRYRIQRLGITMPGEHADDT